MTFITKSYQNLFGVRSYINTIKIMEDNLKISQMPPVETATGEEMIPCVTGSPKENKSVTVSKIRQDKTRHGNGRKLCSYRQQLYYPVKNQT